MSTSQLDYPLIGPPTISLAAFRNVLAAAHSPMTGEAAGIYNAFVAKGINPAIGLAIAQHESSFGKAGIAVGRNNPYGDRYYPGALAGRNAGGWQGFASYTAAARYEAALLAGPGYAGSKTHNTIRGALARYAPAADHNNPTAYGNAVVALISRWSAGRGAIPVGKAAAVSSTSSHAHAHATPAPAGILGAARAHVAAHPAATGAAGGIGTAVVLLLLL